MQHQLVMTWPSKVQPCPTSSVTELAWISLVSTFRFSHGSRRTVKNGEGLASLIHLKGKNGGHAYVIDKHVESKAKLKNFRKPYFYGLRQICENYSVVSGDIKGR